MSTVLMLVANPGRQWCPGCDQWSVRCVCARSAVADLARNRLLYTEKRVAAGQAIVSVLVCCDGTLMICSLLHSLSFSVLSVHHQRKRQRQRQYRKWQIDRADIHLIHSSGRWSNDSAAQTDNTATLLLLLMLIAPLSIHSLTHC